MILCDHVANSQRSEKRCCREKTCCLQAAQPRDVGCSVTGWCRSPSAELRDSYKAKCMHIAGENKSCSTTEVKKDRFNDLKNNKKKM